MAFAKRQFPLSVGAEAACEVVAVGDGVTALAPGDRVVPYAALVCGTCRACARGRENLCENVAGVRGFHVDGFAQELTNHPARLTAKLPDGVDLRDAACVAVAYATVEHMLFDNARLEPGETILVHAGGSGIGSIAIRVAKALGCTVITTVGSDDKAAKAARTRRRPRDQLPHRPFRGRGAQAHRPPRRRRGVRACRRRHLERLAAVAEARRPAGDLRRDIGAGRQHQPDAAVPAAVPHHRLVRLAAERASAARWTASHPACGR